MTEPSPQMAPYTLGSASRPRHDAQIENLYNEFETLKSQIYGFD
jgi:ABC-type transporter MlaC component